ncbi:hypothetical protein DXG01_014916 [Tephrocybe rancida]|nr:hypothetical protein DXG01_014916 [Tephrocybe rancida]
MLDNVQTQRPAAMPTELYRNIFQFATDNDLLALAQVSRTFQEEAEAIIYYYIELQNTFANRKTAMNWCLSVSNNPRRAQCVHSLKFPSTFKTPLTDDFSVDVQQTIASAFNAIINLKHLWLLGVGEKYTASLNPSTLKNCTFSLISLGGQTASFGSDDMWDFLRRNPTIEYWAPTVPLLSSVSSIPTDVLPNLRRAVIVDPTKVRSLAGRPIDSLCIVFVTPYHSQDAGLDAVIPLRALSATLHTLSYTHGPLRGWSVVDMLHSLARSSPNLKSLTFTSFGTNTDVIKIDNRPRLVAAVAQFQCLETLVLTTSIETLPRSSESEMNRNIATTSQEDQKKWDESSLNPTECLEVASLFTRSTTSLVELSLSFKNGTNGEKVLTYIRSDSDPREARFDGFYTIDTSGWWMR